MHDPSPGVDVAVDRHLDYGVDLARARVVTRSAHMTPAWPRARSRAVGRCNEVRLSGASPRRAEFLRCDVDLQSVGAELGGRPRTIP